MTPHVTLRRLSRGWWLAQVGPVYWAGWSNAVDHMLEWELRRREGT